MESKIINDLTDGEFRILDLIVNSEYHDGFEIVGSPVWQVTKTKQDSGYMASCVKKGYAGVWNGIKKDATCWITAKGYNAYLSHKNKLS